MMQLGASGWRQAALALGCLMLLVRISAIVAQEVSDEDLRAWGEFKRQFNKSYERLEEEQRRMAIFLDNRRYIASQNVKATPNSFVQGVSSLSDLSTEEINASRCGFRLPDSFESTDYFDSSHQRASSDLLLTTLLEAFNATSGGLQDEPAGANSSESRAWYESLLTRPELDYREQGVVSRVKDQGGCGSCWAFATTGALESLLARREGRQVLLSEQNLVDCSGRYGNQGCQGGLMTAALRYVRDHGIMASRDYPYAGADKQCQFKASQSVTRVRGSMVLPRGNEALLRLALALSGPLPVSIDAGARSFHSYKSGVYDDIVCRSSARAMNHAVLLVGYGTTSAGADFWLLKNSWGRSWGDNGYIKLARNRRNLCGVATFAVLPIP